MSREQRLWIARDSIYEREEERLLPLDDAGVALAFGSARPPFRTRAVRADTSTSQTSVSPGSRPRTVATDCGTVVLRDSEPVTARKVFDSNRAGNALSERRMWVALDNIDRSVGQLLGLGYKYRGRHRSKHRPMKLGWDAATRQRSSRASRLLSRVEAPVEPVGKVEFKVRSESGRGFYRVRLNLGTWMCECPDWVDRRLPCKHILVVIHTLDPDPSTKTQLGLHPTNHTYQQDWPAYDAAQQAEHPLFDALLWDLLEQVPDRIRLVGRPGRDRLPLRTELLVTVKKVHLAESMRRSKGLLHVQYSNGQGILAHVPNYAVPSRVLNRPETTGQLLGLIRLSCLPLYDLEDSGTVAIDSTGFCTTCRGSYCTEKHNPGRTHRWVKGHFIIGVKTHIVLAAKITDEYGADCPQFVPLLREVVESGLQPSVVAGDKAYSSRENHDAAALFGIDPVIPFKEGSRAHARGSPMWNKKFHEFEVKRDEFDQKYHLRSNIESVNSAMKRKLGEPLFSKTSLAQMNEVLAKVLAYNIGVIVHEIYEHGIDPGVTGLARPRPRPTGPPLETACDFIEPSVTKSPVEASEHSI